MINGVKMHADCSISGNEAASDNNEDGSENSRTRRGCKGHATGAAWG